MRHEAEGVFAHLGKVLNSIEDDLVLPLGAHSAADRGGFLGVSRQVFCYFDYLGALAYSSNPGKSTTKDAVQFMETYLVSGNDVYAGKCKLMYHMWRHGTVHELDPKSVEGGNPQFILRWMANNGPEGHNRKWHLTCLCFRDEANRYHWNVNLFELIDDLRSSILHFMNALERDSGLLARAQENLDRLSKPERLDDDSKSDLLSEALAVIDGASGVVDEHGNVVQEFKTSAERDEFRATWTSQLT